MYARTSLTLAAPVNQNGTFNIPNFDPVLSTPAHKLIKSDGTTWVAPTDFTITPLTGNRGLVTWLNVGQLLAGDYTLAIAYIDNLNTGTQAQIVAGGATAANQTAYAAVFGAQNDSIAGSDGATASFMSLFKRLLTSISSMVTSLAALVSDTTPAAVYTNLRVIDVDLTVSTSAYSANDVLVATFAIAGAAAAADLPCTLQRVYLVDWDGVAPGSGVIAMFWDANISLGAANAVAAFGSQADAKHYQGHVAINSLAQAIGTPKVNTATAANFGIPMKPASGTTTIYCTLFLSTGTPTFTHADALSARFVFS